MEIAFHVPNSNTQFVGDENRPPAQVTFIAYRWMFKYLSSDGDQNFCDDVKFCIFAPGLSR